MHKLYSVFLIPFLWLPFSLQASESLMWLACSKARSDKDCHQTCGQLVAGPQCKNTQEACLSPQDCYHKPVPSWPTKTLITTLVTTVDSIQATQNQYGAFYHSNWFKTKAGKDYLYQIYGDRYPEIDATNISFFYPSFPFRESLFTSFPNAAYYPEGVPMNKLWIPAFWPGKRTYPWVSSLTRAIRNRYNPSNGLWNNAYQPLTGRIEIAHMRGDDIGWWAYYTPGSGIYIPLGKTIAVLNKLDYLVSVMHLSFEEIAKLPGWDVPDMANPNGNPNGIVFRHWPYLRAILLGQSVSDTRDKTKHLFIQQNTSLADLLRFAIHGDNKWLNILTIGTHDTNRIIYEDAKKRGLDSVQFLAQPNPIGGWMAEILFIVDDKDEKAIKDLESKIELYNQKPCKLNYIATYPGFGLQDQHMLTCSNLPISGRESLSNSAVASVK